MKMNLIKYILFILVLLQTITSAQTFTASVSHSKIGLEDRFELAFTFSAANVNGLKNFNPPDLSRFYVLSGPNQSTSMQFVNGVASGSKTYSFFLKGKSAGKFEIGSASIEFEGKTYKSNPVSVEFVKGSSQPQQNNQVSVDEEISKNLFVKATADKRRVYQGEQVTVTYKLYTRLNIASQMSVSKLPQYKGFWAEELETDKNILFTTEVIDGKQFRVGILKKVALFPTQSGELSVSPFEINVPVLIQNKKRGNSIFDEFFADPFNRGETVDYLAKSNTLTINVLPLPDKEKPETFSGAVGDFRLTTSLDREETITNEPVNLKVEINGSGNIKLLDISEIKLPTGVEKYDPKVSEHINRNGKISGRKILEYLIVPRTPGSKEIPEIKFSYFNPSKKSYVTLSSPSYTVKVKQGERVFEPDISGLNKEDIQLLSDDIRYIKTSANLDKKSGLLINNFGFWTAVGVPLLALVGLIAFKKRDEKLSANVQLLKYNRAQKIAKNRLKNAAVLMSAHKDAEFYTELSQALFGYLEDKLKIPKSEFSLDRAVLELRNRNVDENIIERFQRTAQKCEYVRFAPSANGVAAMNDMYNELSELIIDIEKAVSVRKYA
ncbi:MAG: protein BatD [Ignavibacteriales bacterium]|nr:MAG: protein BatD [Ignavibacteriales bacterium]